MVFPLDTCLQNPFNMGGLTPVFKWPSSRIHSSWNGKTFTFIKIVPPFLMNFSFIKKKITSSYSSLKISSTIIFKSLPEIPFLFGFSRFYSFSSRNHIIFKISFKGIGSSLVISLCDTLISQHFKLKLKSVNNLIQITISLGFVFVPIILGHYIVRNGISHTLLWYQIVILQGLIVSMLFKKPPYLKGTQSYKAIGVSSLMFFFVAFYFNFNFTIQTEIARRRRRCLLETGDRIKKYSSSSYRR